MLYTLLNVSKQREKEIGVAIKKMVSSVLGDRAEEMFEVVALSTSREKQGRGYGTALMKFVDDVVSSAA